jgi:hypothetical protein
MKRISFIALLILAVALIAYRGHLLPLIHGAPRTYSFSHASKEVGKYATITGKVAEVSISETGTVFLDFGGAYPNQSFTAVIPAGESSSFIELGAYRGRSVDVTGRVHLYRGKPEIVVRSQHQLKLLN